MMLRSLHKSPFNAVIVRRRITNTVMSFEDSSYGALGLPTSVVGINSNAYKPTSIPSLPPDVSTIAAGHYHSVAVTSTFHLWSWSRNVEHQLGRAIDSPREKWVEPERVNELSGVSLVFS